MRRIAYLWLFLSMVLSPVAAFAAPARPLLGLNAEFGGDTLLTVIYSDGSTSKVQAGEGLSLFGGVALEGLVPMGALSIDLQGTVGVKYSTTRQASNGSADYFRFPLEVLVLGHWRDLRFGAGPVYHFANSFSGSGILSGFNFNLDNALGVKAQVDYTLSNINFGVSYTAISYKVSGLGITTNANNFGVALGFFLI
jgi:hypothetical protein